MELKFCSCFFAKSSYTPISIIISARHLLYSITIIELNVSQDFMNRFSAVKLLPHTDAGRFPSANVK